MTDTDHAEVDRPAINKQGWQVWSLGIVSSIFGILPAIFFNPNWDLHISGNVYHIRFASNTFQTVTLFAWACIVGVPFTYWWSKALHDRVDQAGFREEEPAQNPRRIDWMPAWIGVFERAFYCFLIAYEVAGGAGFIGTWIALKTAGGWQIWSKGTTYGRAVLFAGLLGNAMSVLFGVVPGLMIRFYIRHRT